MPQTDLGGRREGPYQSVGQGRPGLGARGEGAYSGVREEKKVALGRALHHTLAPYRTAHLDFQLECGRGREEGFSHLFISQTSVAVMKSSQDDADCRSGLQLVTRVDPECCGPVCRKTQAERVVVALLLGALLIIFLTVILSLVYLRETTTQAAGLVLAPNQDPQGRRWAAANSIRTKGPPSAPPPPATCQTPSCWSAARRLSSWLKPGADPCNSLHALACGRWGAGGPVPGDLDIFSVMDDREKEVEVKLGDLAEALPPSSPLAPLHTFLTSCRDTLAIRQMGLKPAIEFLHKKFGQHLEPGAGDSEDLTQVVADILSYSGNALFDLGLDIDPRDNNQLLGVISLPRPKQQARPALRDQVVNSGNYSEGVGGTEPSSSDNLYKEVQAAAAAQRIGRLFALVENYKILDNYSQPFKQSTTEEIVGFVAALTKLVPSLEQEREEVAANRVYNTYNLAELQSSFRYINWKKLMRTVFGEGVNSSSLFLVHFPSFLRQLDRLVSLFGVRVARISLVALFAQESLEELSSVARSRLPRWRYCSSMTKALFPLPSSHLFLTSFSPGVRRDIVAKAKEVGRQVKRAAIRHLEDTQWLSRQTRSKVMQKVATMRIFMEPPQLFLNVTAVSSHLASLDLSTSDFFSNVLTGRRHQRTQLYSLLQSGLDSSLFPWLVTTSPLAVTAARIRQFNSVVIPFGLLSQSLAGGEGLPSYLNTAQLAMVIGHELVHGLDTAGKGFDLQGRLEQVWDHSSLVRYERQASCLIRQVAAPRQLLYRGKSVSLARHPKLTFDEDLADSLALQLAASVAWAGREEQVALPGLNLTQEQVFYINLAQSYCGRTGALAEILLSELSQHSALAERTDRMVVGDRRYSKAFRCQKGTKMNPVSKCPRMFGQ